MGRNHLESQGEGEGIMTKFVTMDELKKKDKSNSDSINRI
jgi:hypothetical protein